MRIYDVNEFLNLIEVLRVRGKPPLLTPFRWYQAHIFYDAGLAAKFELKTLEAFRNKRGDWEWSTIPKSLGSAFYNLSLWKSGGPFDVFAVICRTGDNEWRVHKVKGKHSQ